MKINNSSNISTNFLIDKIKAKTIDSNILLAEKEKMNSKKNNGLSDKIEISGDAMKINFIKSKISSGFYNDEKIIKEVAEKLLMFIGE